MIFWTRGGRTTSELLKVWKSMPGMSPRMWRASSRPLCLGTREVDLGDVAGHDHARVLAEAGEEHHHLLGRGVLRLVEHDEGAREGAAAHVGERGDLDDALLGQPGHVLGIEHVAERVVERAKIRQNFFAEVAGRKPASRPPRRPGG